MLFFPLSFLFNFTYFFVGMCDQAATLHDITHWLAAILKPGVCLTVHHHFAFLEAEGGECLSDHFNGSALDSNIV